MYTDTDNHRRDNDRMKGMIAEWKQKKDRDVMKNRTKKERHERLNAAKIQCVSIKHTDPEDRERGLE